MPNVSILNPSISFLQKFTLISNFKINLKVFWIISLISIMLLLVFYIFQVNSLISANYLLREYEKKLIALNKENKDLKIKFEQVNSLENVERLLGALNFEKVNKIYYIRVLEGQVVKGSNQPASP